MTPVIPTFINNVPLIPGTPFATRKNECIKRCSLLRNSTKQTWSSQKNVLPRSISFGLFPQFRSGFFLCHKSRTHIISATGTDLAVEEAESPFADEDSGGTSEESSVKSDSSVIPAQSKRSKPARKSEMPPVKPEELVPGATFTGKVRSIQPFGAFVDFGAFTDGLVHVSKLSDTFVKDVGNIVSVGQEVKVRLVEANMETGRISLTMRESDDLSRLQQRKDTPSGSDKARPPRKGPPKSNQKKTSKFVKGQDLEGTVKNLTRSGAFISLPEGEEGFLPSSEELDEGLGNLMGGGSSLQVGQEVSVRVLRITRGQVTLTMKKEEAAGELDSKLNQGVVHAATNPFVLAFRQNKDIGAFLDEREKELELAELAESSGIPQSSDELEGKVSQTETELGEVQDQQTSSNGSEKIESKVNQTGTELDEVQDQQASSSEGLVSALSAVDEIVEDNQTSSMEVDMETSTEEDTSNETELDEVLDQQTSSIEPDKIEAKVNQIGTELDEVQDQQASSSEGLVSALSAVDEMVYDDKTSSKEVGVEASTAEDVSNEIANDIKDPESIVADKSDGIDGLVQRIEEEADVRSEILAPEESITTSDQVPTENKVSKEITQIAENNESPENMVLDSLQSVDSEAKIIEEKVVVSSEILSPEGDVSVTKEVSVTDVAESDEISDLSGQIANPIMSESPIGKEVTESQADDTTPKDEVQIPTPNAGNEILTAVIGKDEMVGVNPDKNGSIASSKVQIDVPALQQNTTEESQVSEELENEIDNTKAKDELKNEIPAASNEIPPATLVEDEKVGSVPEKNGTSTNSNGQGGAPSPKESTTKAISPALVKQLREETGAGMMDCKKALSETGGDLLKAQEFLRKKGLASADKKSSRATAEGRIGSYIHDNRIGVLIEVNCETDFVSRGEIFKELVDDLAMQVAACPQVQYLVTDDVPKEIVDKEREIEMQKEDLLSKPEQIRSKIVDGRIRKRLEELALLEQTYIKNDKLVVKDLVKQTIATIGENMKVKRFVRYNLGEGLEKKSQDFAAEVAAQTAAKLMPSPGKEQSAVVDTKETVDKPPKVAVSAALVKQLREETGAGMMDCKKALSETGGDLEKAQEYLRKKGLSSADKKSSRLVAEGRIGSYIHDSRIGVLIEVNCETDFVGRSENFKELVDDLAMQVAACPQVQYVSIEDIPESIVSKEKELEMQREDLLSKPENIRERIVVGRISKRLGELALLEQPFIKNDSILVKDLVKQTVAALGENIKVRRFVRFTLGETSESANAQNEA